MAPPSRRRLSCCQTNQKVEHDLTNIQTYKISGTTDTETVGNTCIYKLPKMECKIFVPLEVCRTTNHVVDRTPLKGPNCSHNGMRYAVWTLSFVVVLLVLSNVHLHLQVYRLHSGPPDCLQKNEAIHLPGTSQTKQPKVISAEKHDTEQNSLISSSAEYEDPFVSSALKVISAKKHHAEQGARFKRSRNRPGHSRRRKRLQDQIDDLKAAILKQAVHLRGNRNVRPATTRTSVHNVPACSPHGCFRWNLADNIYATNFGYIKDTANNKVVGVNITSPGVYLIYSQVGVNGPRQGFDPSVGYETVRTDSAGTTTVLMRTFATQDEKGKRYHGPNAQFPHDSLNHFGMFKLYCHDVVVVRQATPVSSYPPDFIFDQYQSFFGIVQINPTNGALDGNYDCNSS